MGLRFAVRMFICFMLLLLSCGGAFAGREVYLASIDWPPYTGQNLPGNGKSASIVREAFASMGYDLKIVFVPWKRAMRMAEESDQVVGYFPEYYSAERAEKFVFSSPFSCSPVGLLLPGDRPLRWNTVDDLAKVRLGFVSGYVNTADLDNAVANGTIIADYTTNDKSNILKVAAGRVAGAVIDPYVYNFLSKTSPEVEKVSGRLTMHPVRFGTNELYVAFRRNPMGHRYADIFNNGLKKMKKVQGTLPCKNDTPNK